MRLWCIHIPFIQLELFKRVSDCWYRRLDNYLRKSQHQLDVMLATMVKWTFLHSQTPGSGRSRTADVRQDRHFLKNVVADHTAFIVEIRKNGASKRANTYRWKPFTCSRTTDTHAFIQTYASMHRRARFYWCRERVTWRDLVLTDDSRFCLYVSDFRLCVRCKLEEYIHSLHTGTSHGIMAWSIMSYNTCSSLVLEDGTLNSPMYI